MTEETKEPMNFDSYQDALETGALAKMEINEIFKPAASRQKKLWKLIFGEKDTGKFVNAKNLLFYQAGVPKEDAKAKMEKLRSQVQSMMEIFTGMGLGDNVQSYFKEVGINIELSRDQYADYKNFKPKDKVEKLWDLEFFGEEMPYTGQDILKKLMDRAQNTESDIVEANHHIQEDILESACTQFDIAPGAFKKAMDLMVDEKNGKDIQEKLEAIETGRVLLDKALEPFTHEDE